MIAAKQNRRHRYSPLLGLALVLGLTLTLLSPRAEGAGLDAAHFTLDNGLEVVVIPDHRTPVVTHMVWYKVGSADETPGKSGLAHFLEHLMFKGTKKNPLGRYSQTVATLGGQENAFTTADYTVFYQRVPHERLKTLMEFESDRMTGLVLTDQVVKPELQVVLEEQNMRVANNPGARLSEQMEAALYLNHPYGRPVIGWRHEIEKLNREQALDFYRRFYTPNNAILVVAGDVTADEVKSLAEETYGKVERVVEVPPRDRPKEPAQEAARTVTLADPRVAQPSLRRIYLAPSATTAAAGESEALDVLASILGSGENSRLYQRLVVDKDMAVNAGAGYDAIALDYAPFQVSVTPKPGITLPQIEAAMDDVLAQVIENGVTASELARAKNSLIAQAIYAQDNQTTMARWFGAALATGLTVEQVETWPARVQQVTADAVRAAARRYLDKRSSVTGYLIRDAASPEGKHT
ncbi:MAG TPA: pitrilysin family protein [Xanthobacteraceae bacterium]|nr:pitrilysin family protein [Xanthobacteraceae bacterium]